MNHKKAMKFLNAIDPEAAEGLSQARQMAPELLDILIENLYGVAYQREALSQRERALVTIAALMGNDRFQAQLATHTRLALKTGLKREELMEVAFQISVLFNLGSSLNAMSIVDAVSDRLEMEG